MLLPRPKQARCRICAPRRVWKAAASATADSWFTYKTADGCKAGWTCVDRHAPVGRGAERRLRVNWDLTKNITELFTPAGQLDTDYVYTPFGEVRPAGNLTQPIQWSSECYDPETALVYYNYRYYNTQDGRWTRRDPIGIKGEVNLYAFGNNIPTQTFDRLGKDLYAIDGTNYDYGKSGNVAKFYDWYQGMSDSLYNS